MKILLVEDDDLLASMLQTVLTEHHHTVDVASDGLKAWDLAESFNYDLIVLDVMLPKLDGITLCRRLRSNRLSMPILLLTAKDSKNDKVMGFDAGADDYVVKPFDPEELAARIRALLRRKGTALPPVLGWGLLRLDPNTCTVSYAGQPLHLTPKEYGLLELFLRNNNRVFSRNAILEQLWSFEESPAEETVRAHIKGLRMKLKAAGAPADVIETVYGLGYRLKPYNTLESDSTQTPQETEVSEPQQRRQEALSLENSLPLAQPDQTRQKIEPSLQEATQTSLPTLCEVGNASLPLSEKMKAAVALLWEQFKEPIKQRVSIVENAIAALKEGVLTLELQLDAEREAHKLAGSLGTYGFAEGSRIARKLENLLACSGLKSEQEPVLRDLVIALRSEVEGGTKSPKPAPAQELRSPIPPLQKLNPKTTSFFQHQPLLLVIKTDPELEEELTQLANSQGMRVQGVDDWTAARGCLQALQPDAVLLDLSNADTAVAGLEFLSELTNRAQPLPVLVLTSRDGFADRLDVARRGGKAFLQKPVTAAAVMDAVADVLKRYQTHQSKVMIVDDDVHVLAALQTLLKPWGFKLTTLDDPTQFWDTLEACSPELLVLDVEMPQVSGIELCQVVRNDPRWAGMPILFLTAHTDENTVHQVFACGGDDYVTKPVVGPELVTRILNRLERTHLLRSMAETDTLTGLANRRKSIQDLGQLLRLADRYTQPLCFAVLDLDYFKQVNDCYGHTAGDAVLHRLGELLLRSFRSEDVVARWGGEEFVVGMYGMSKFDGVKRLSEFLQVFRQEIFGNPSEATFEVTFSAGVVEYPTDGTDLQALYRYADKALYQAKQAGRNRVQLLED
ncbi:response regulator [Ancylothrix sp. C2]|uniref:response regulator n=1 Tax=Ancylothrix sp. D3o TaxID=2953691 RepID=UPI0021BB683A|nr:response regulator [Ancylothrix sp. D3o]MCT7948692.1 response regulator [Ancylothrix sp. D3o]